MTKDVVFLFVISSLVPEIFRILYYANKLTDDRHNCSITVKKHKLTNISANEKAMRMKLGNSNVLQEIHRVVHVLVLLWQHPWF